MSTTRSPLARRSVIAMRSVETAALPDIPTLISQDAFVAMVRIEQKRTERSGRYFVLLVVDRNGLKEAFKRENDLEAILAALSIASRETDLKGWYREQEQIGVIFTEIPAGDAKAVVQVLEDRIRCELASAFRVDSVSARFLTFKIFPEDWYSKGKSGSGVSSQLPDLIRDQPKVAPLVLKRGLDILGSLAAIAVLSPIFAVTALAVKLTSKGPIIFRQERVGQHGRRFTFLKFRSMQVANDSSIHEEFVKKLISGDSPKTETGHEVPLFKIAQDPRVTPVGRFLRRSSLDELPQFFNVLLGDMSLVGPRPPVPYEVDRYQIWHAQRLLSVKPGITGLWQVEGRSRVKFDDMVRMDLRYARSWSVWLDVKILFRTPKAVLGGTGAV